MYFIEITGKYETGTKTIPGSFQKKSEHLETLRLSGKSVPSHTTPE